MDEDNKILDRFIGQKIKDRRKALDLTQGELAQVLGVSHQQVQRYESGENTITVSRLLEIARCLNVNLDYFYAQVPTRQMDGKMAEQGLIGRGRHRPLRLLLVEDSASDELLFRKGMEKSGVPVDFHAIQKPESVAPYLLEYAKGRPLPDVIVMDINMPRLNGIDLLRQIKSYPQLSIIPIVMLTNSARSKDLTDAYAEHASGYIQKNSDLIGFFKDIELLLRYWSQVVLVPGNTTAIQEAG